MDFDCDVILSCKYVWRKDEMQTKYYVEEQKIVSANNPTRHVVSFVTLIQLEDVYGNIGRACCTYGK